MKVSTTILNKENAEFTPLQKERLRKGIDAFRLENISNGVMPSLSYVAYEIESFRPENHANEDTDKNYLLKAERIRRFLKGAPVSPEKLQLMKDFLIDVEILTEEDFSSEQDDTHAFLKVLAYLANTNKISKKKLSKLKPSIVASRQTPSISEKIRLDIQVDPSGLFFRVMEYFENNVPDKSYIPQEIATKKEQGNRGKIFRRGYGFTSTNGYLIHIFLRGGDSMDRITYTETLSHPLEFNSRGTIFTRHSGDVFDPAHEESMEEKITRCLNTYNFLPAEAEKETEDKP